MIEVSARPAPDTEATRTAHATRDPSTEKSSGGSTVEREAMGEATSGVGQPGRQKESERQQERFRLAERMP